jgi:uncharacterized beta-barrel protein YwiB (DUF1934 family)
MRCISVYTSDYSRFSDLYEQILRTPLGEHEEKTLEGVVFCDSGETSVEFLNRLKQKPEVAVLKLKDSEITILQHGEVFEIFLPESENVVH